MQEELFTLRQNTYEAAGNFLHAQGQYFYHLFSKQPKGIEAALSQVQETGEVYMRALHALLNYLQAANYEHRPGEIERTRIIIELLERQMDQAPSLMKTECARLSQ